MNFLRNCRDSVMKTNNSTGHRESSDASFMETESSDADTSSSYARRAHHAGSWYSSDADDLDDMLSNFLADAEDDDDGDDVAAPSIRENTSAPGGIPNACISPHAGFRYSGPTAAYSYLALKEAILKNSSLRTIVVVGARHGISIIATSQWVCMRSPLLVVLYILCGLASSIAPCIFGWLCNVR